MYMHVHNVHVYVSTQYTCICPCALLSVVCFPIGTIPTSSRTAHLTEVTQRCLVCCHWFPELDIVVYTTGGNHYTQEDTCTCTLYMKKSGGPEQKSTLWTAVLSLLALISAVQHNLLRDPVGFIMYMYVNSKKYHTQTCTQFTVSEARYSMC